MEKRKFIIPIGNLSEEEVKEKVKELRKLFGNKINMEKQEVYNRVDGELKYQDLRWVPRREANGTPDEAKPPAEWINYMEFHIAEAKKEVYHLNDNEALAQIRKVVALGVRALMIHGCPERVIPEDLLDDKAE